MNWEIAKAITHNKQLIEIHLLPTIHSILCWNQFISLNFIVVEWIVLKQSYYNSKVAYYIHGQYDLKLCWAMNGMQASAIRQLRKWLNWFAAHASKEIHSIPNWLNAGSEQQTMIGVNGKNEKNWLRECRPPHCVNSLSSLLSVMNKLNYTPLAGCAAGAFFI